MQPPEELFVDMYVNKSHPRGASGVKRASVITSHDTLLVYDTGHKYRHRKLFMFSVTGRWPCLSENVKLTVGANVNNTTRYVRDKYTITHFVFAIDH